MWRLPGFRGHVYVSSMHNTSAERVPLSPSSYRACLAKAWLSRAHFLSSRRCFRAISPEICRKVICARHSISHARYAATCTGETEREGSNPRNSPDFSKEERWSIVLSWEAQLRDKRFWSLGIKVAVVILSLCIHSTLSTVFRSLPLGNVTEAQWIPDFTKSMISPAWLNRIKLR